jgi:RNA polymerase sigma-70 factor (ECF subfamily)
MHDALAMSADTEDREASDAQATSEAAVRALVAGHARFLSFLERRVESPEVAEEILQEAFAKSLEKGRSLLDGEAATAWFYRLLRNAIVDHYRRRDVERRALASVAEEPTEAFDEALMSTVCGCVSDLLIALKPEYAEVLRAVELEGSRVRDYAARAGITDGNASVRLHRAKLALRRSLERCCGSCVTHGCLDCHCAGSAHTA